MPTRTLLAAVATAAVAAIATPSLSSAQDTTKTTTTSKGEVAMSPSFGSLISALNSTSAHADKIKSMTDLSASNVTLVNVEDLVKGNNSEALTNAITKNQADIAALRTALGGNSTISALLAPATTATTTTTDTTAKTATATATATPSLNDVIAADVGADGKVVLYYWKKPA